MSRERFRRQEKGSFFGNFIYDRIVPAGHFMRKLDEVVPWERLTKKLVKLYRGRARQGRAPYDPAVLLKMLLVCYLYDVSERQVKALANDSLSIKCFLGLAADELAPDHSTLSAFKRRILENGKLAAFEELLVEIVCLAQEQGIKLGSLQVMDSVHTEANVNVQKDARRQKREGKPPRDRGARWGVKHTRRVKDAKGKTVRQKVYFHGYKAHVSLNAETGLITSALVVGLPWPPLSRKAARAGMQGQPRRGRDDAGVAPCTSQRCDSTIQAGCQRQVGTNEGFATHVVGGSGVSTPSCC